MISSGHNDTDFLIKYVREASEKNIFHHYLGQSDIFSSGSFRTDRGVHFVWIREKMYVMYVLSKLMC